MPKLFTRSSLSAVALAFILSACGGGGSSGNDSVPPPNDEPVPGDPAPIDASACAEVIDPVGGGITVPMTLFNTDSACDFYIPGYTLFQSSVTIEPGTVIVMGQSASLFFEDGVFNAVGTPGQRIVIRGETPLQGFWSGITVFGVRPSRIEYVDSMDGGDTSAGVEGRDFGLWVGSDSTISLVDVSVSNSFVGGARLDGTVRLTEFARNRFYGNALAGFTVQMNLIPQLSARPRRNQPAYPGPASGS